MDWFLCAVDDAFSGWLISCSKLSTVPHACLARGKRGISTIVVSILFFTLDGR